MVDFGVEWNTFIFGLREEMKRVQFFPVVQDEEVQSELELESDSDPDEMMLRPRMLMI